MRRTLFIGLITIAAIAAALACPAPASADVAHIIKWTIRAQDGCNVIRIDHDDTVYEFPVSDAEWGAIVAHAQTRRVPVEGMALEKYILHAGWLINSHTQEWDLVFHNAGRKIADTIQLHGTRPKLTQAEEDAITHCPTADKQFAISHGLLFASNGKSEIYFAPKGMKFVVDVGGKFLRGTIEGAKLVWTDDTL